MNLDTMIISAILISLLIGITLLAINNSFGKNAKKFIDPFEEEDL